MNKNKRNIAYILLTVVGLSTFSCTKDFTKVNVDPLGQSEVAPDKLLAPSLVSLMRTNMLRNRNFNNELMQVTVDRNEGEGRVFRYDVRATQADNTWNNWYVALTDIKDIYRTAGTDKYKNTSYQAISLIVQAWGYQLLTDTYGDVPYSEANNGKGDLISASSRVIQPKFDKQKDIYLDLFKKLEEANELLKAGEAIVSDSDPVYSGDVARWRKLGNSLYLRMLMRLSGKSEVSTEVRAKIKEIIDTDTQNYPIMSNNHFSNQKVGNRYYNDSDNAVILWNGNNAASAVYTSPFMTNVRANDFRLVNVAEFFAANLINWSHPCYLNMGAPSYTSRWSFDGADPVESGYASNTLDPNGNYMHFNSDQDTDGTGTSARKKSYNLQIDAYTGIIMNVAELDFIKAEAALNGWINGNPADFYYQGMVNAVNYWRPNYFTGINDTKFQSYITAGDLGFDGLPLHSSVYGVRSKMNSILLQKYYAMFLVDFQQWFEYRRTGYPVMPVGPAIVSSGRQMPSRLNYPVIVQSTNPTNYKNAVAAQGADDVNTKVWWQKP
jgi:hypothetical protein